jgi:hypothetical protein
MKYSIIGSGLVGRALHQQLPSSTIYNRNESNTLIGQSLDVVIVAAPTGNRISVTQDPVKDLNDCQQIIKLLEQCKYNQVVYISTLDVYSNKTSTDANPDLVQPTASYGRNRWLLEQAIGAMPNGYVTRLSSLSDRSMTKNILYDLKAQIWLDKICLDSCIQWYPLNRLAADIVASLDYKIKYQNLCSLPIRNRDIVQKFFPTLISKLDKNTVIPVTYNVKNYDQDYAVPLDQIWQSFDEFFIDHSENLVYNKQSKEN